MGLMWERVCEILHGLETSQVMAQSLSKMTKFTNVSVFFGVITSA